VLHFRICIEVQDSQQAITASEALGDLEYSVPLLDFDVSGVGDEISYTVEADYVDRAQEVADEIIEVLAASGVVAFASVSRLIA
jgi:hypothetical protein